MNPYKHINKNVGLSINEKSPFYGRFVLRFDQIHPFRKLSFEHALLKIKDECIQDVKIIHEFLPDHIQLFHLYENQNNCWYVDIHLAADYTWIAMENFYFALLELNPYLEEYHFFTYSYSEDKDRWVDEYMNKNDQLICNRIVYDKELFYGIIIYYISKSDATPEYRDLTFYTAFKIYRKFHFILCIHKDETKEKRFIQSCSTDIVLYRFYSDLKKLYTIFYYDCLLFKKIEYKYIQSSFNTWCSENNV